MPKYPIGCLRCKRKGKEFISNSDADKYAHNKNVHGYVNGKPPEGDRIFSRKRHAVKAEHDGVPELPLDKVKYHKQGIRQAMREIDAERATLMTRIKEIDDLMASWKVFTGQV